MISWNQIHHFKPNEFVAPQCLRWEMLLKLDRLRDMCGFSLIVTSSYRNPFHNAEVGGVENSAHCLAPDGFYSGVDLRTDNIGGAGLFKLVRNAIHVGYNRIGIYNRHIHLDVEDRLPQQVMWVGDD